MKFEVVLVSVLNAIVSLSPHTVGICIKLSRKLAHEDRLISSCVVSDVFSSHINSDLF
jgi:hypothetical protein